MRYLYYMSAQGRPESLETGLNHEPERDTTSNTSAACRADSTRYMYTPGTSEGMPFKLKIMHPPALGGIAQES